MARKSGGKRQRSPAILTITASEGANLYTTSQAQQYLGYEHPGSIRKLVSLDKLHPRRFGRDLLFFKDDLDRFKETANRTPGRRPHMKTAKAKSAVKLRKALRGTTNQGKTTKKKKRMGKD